MNHQLTLFLKFAWQRMQPRKKGEVIAVLDEFNFQEFQATKETNILTTYFLFFCQIAKCQHERFKNVGKKIPSKIFRKEIN